MVKTNSRSLVGKASAIAIDAVGYVLFVVGTLGFVGNLFFGSIALVSWLGHAQHVGLVVVAGLGAALSWVVRVAGRRTSAWALAAEAWVLATEEHADSVAERKRYEDVFA